MKLYNIAIIASLTLTSTNCWAADAKQEEPPFKMRYPSSRQERNRAADNKQKVVDLTATVAQLTQERDALKAQVAAFMQAQARGRESDLDQMVLMAQAASITGKPG